MIKCKRISLFAALLAVCVATLGLSSQAQAQSQDVTIGYVDPQAILSRMPEMKAVQQRLTNFYQRKQQELAQKEQEFNQEVTNYQQKSSVISDEAKQKEEERLGQLNADLQQFRSELQQQMQAKQQELVGPLLEQIRDAIDTVATDMGLTYVINTTTSQGDVIILYASDEAQQKYNITDQVMRELGI